MEESDICVSQDPAQSTVDSGCTIRLLTVHAHPALHMCLAADFAEIPGTVRELPDCKRSAGRLGHKERGTAEAAASLECVQGVHCTSG